MINWLYYNYWARSVAMAFLIPIFVIWFLVSFVNAEFMTINIFEWGRGVRVIVLLLALLVMGVRGIFFNFNRK